MSETSTKSIVELLAAQVTANPHLPALAVKTAEGCWSSITFQELWDDAQSLARALRYAGLTKGDCVFIQLDNTAEWEVARFGALLAGCTLVGADVNEPVQQLEFIIRAARPKAILSAQLNLPSSAVLESLKVVVTTKNEYPKVDWVPVFQWMDFLASGDLETVSELPNLSADDPAEMIFTSGTTGVQKGILYTHRQIMAGCLANISLFPELQAGDRTICWLPMAHLFQRMGNLIAIGVGMTNYFIPEPQQAFALLPEVRPQFFTAVPRLLEKLLDELERSEQSSRIDIVKYIVTGSAACPPDVLKQLQARGVLVLEAYGITENTVPVAANRGSNYRFGSVGLPLKENEIQLSEEGELLIRGPGLFDGYMGEGRPADRFTEDGFYLTGDIARFDEHGFLYLISRKAELIKTSTGRRISPTRVEAEYSKSRLFEQIIVVGEGRKYLVGLVVINPKVAEELLIQTTDNEGPDSSGSTLEQLIDAELLRHGEALAGHERVQRVAVLPAPLSAASGELTATLKPRRRIIEERYSALIDAMYEDPE